MAKNQKSVNRYEGLLEDWKVELLEHRVRLAGFRGALMDQAVQDVVIALKEFHYDPALSNGATEATVLTRWIDFKLSKLIRDEARTQARYDRYVQTREASYELTIELQADVQAAVAGLPPFERKVCELLGQGISIRALHRELQCSKSKLMAALRAIRFRFCHLGVDDWLNEK